MRIYFNWQIIRRAIKDAKLGRDARDATSECRYSIMQTQSQKNTRTSPALVFKKKTSVDPIERGGAKF